MRPPVETPSMKSPRLRAAKVPSKHAKTSRISLSLSNVVPLIYQPILFSFHSNLGLESAPNFRGLCR